MKQIILLGLLVLSFIGCTKYNQIDTGLAQKKYPGNMYEYLHSDSYNWDSLLVFIDYLGLEDYFTGKKAGYEEITFSDRRIILSVEKYTRNIHGVLLGRKFTCIIA